MEVKSKPPDIIPGKEIQDYFDVSKVNLYKIQPGDIILFNNHADSLYSNLQKDVQDVRGTDYELTHSAIGWFDLNIPEIGIKDEQQIYEAKEAMTVTFFDENIYNKNVEFWIYRFKDVPQNTLNRVAYSVKRKTDGEPYGFLQILYFEREAFFKRNFIGQLLYPLIKELHGGKEIEQWNNWFPEGYICSELVYLDMLGVGVEMNYKDLLEGMKKWSQDNISPVGIKKIIDWYPNYFTLIAHKPAEG